MKLMGPKARVEGPSSYGRALSRDQQKQHAARMAREASHRRRARQGSSVLRKVEAAEKALVGRNARDAINIIENLRPVDRDVYLLAEERGQARKSILRKFGNVRKAVRARYDTERGIEDEPEED